MITALKLVVVLVTGLLVMLLVAGQAAFSRAVALVKAMPQTTVVEQTPGYLYAQYSTRWLKFTDDLELYLGEAAHVIHVRSASRLGRKDFGVNRARVEALRERFGQATPSPEMLPKQ